MADRSKGSSVLQRAAQYQTNVVNELLKVKDSVTNKMRIITGITNDEDPTEDESVLLDFPEYNIDNLLDFDPEDMKGPDKRFAKVKNIEKYRRGIDISQYNIVSNWKKVKESGIQAVIIRASSGVTIDPKFDKHFTEARANGFLVGVYHYYHKNYTPEEQVKTFLKAMGNYRLDIMPFLDIEPRPGHEKEKFDWQIVKKWLPPVKRKYGRVGLYLAKWAWDSVYNKDKDAYKYPLWVANYGVDTPAIPTHYDKSTNTTYAFNNWVIWQISGSGKVPGVDTLVDLNVLSI